MYLINKTKTPFKPKFGFKASHLVFLMAIIVGSLIVVLINPMLRGLQASPPDYEGYSGPAFYSFLDKDRMETELHLVNYNSRTGHSLPDSVVIYGIAMIPANSRSHCHESHFNDVRRNNSVSFRFQSQIIPELTPPLSLAKFKLTADYVGRYACFRVLMSDENGIRRSYFYASLRPIAKPLLIFDKSFYFGDEPGELALMGLQLHSYNGQSSHFMPDNARAFVGPPQKS